MTRSKAMSLALACLVLVASLGLTACGKKGGGKASFDLTIGDIVPLTGDLADFGPPGRKAADLAVKQINAAIKKDGLKQTVTIKHADEQTAPQPSVAAAKTLVTANHASCIAGAWASADTIPVAESVTIPNRVLQISPASTSDKITPISDNGLLNRTPPPDKDQGPTVANLVAKSLGGAQGKVINIGARNDAYGTGLSGTFATAWTKMGGKIGQKVIYDPNRPSYDAEAAKIVSGNPAGWVIVDFPETFQKVGPALVRTGKWDPKRTFTTDGLASSDLPKNAGKAATEGLRGTAPGTPNTGAASVAFDKLYRAAPGPGRQTFDAQNFDAVILCYLSAVAAGDTNGADMAKKVRDISAPPGTQYTWQQLPQAITALQKGQDIDYQGASGAIDMNDAGDPTAGVYDVYTYKNGKIVPSIEQLPVPKS